jgi:hypothetical protein
LKEMAAHDSPLIAGRVKVGFNGILEINDRV